MATPSPFSSAAQRNAVSAPQQPTMLSVLMVDDSAMDRAWALRQLSSSREFACEFTEAATVKDALAVLGARSFDVAIIDYQLPDGHGDEIVADIERRGQRCATILLSGHTMSEVASIGLKAGATAALSKDDLNSTLLNTTIHFALLNRARHFRTP